MSRKRKLKKQRKRRDQWTLTLEDLYLRGEDQAFLEAARPHFKDLDGSPVAELYGEVVDRALASALAGGEPSRVEELLARIRRDSAPRPLVVLAEAVDLLAHGRREPAAARLSALAEAEAELPVDRHLLGQLQALAQADGESVIDESTSGETPSSEPLWREIEEMTRLSRALEAHVAGAALPRTLALDHPPTRAVWDLYRALAAVGARRPGAKTLASVSRAVAAVRSDAPLDDALERLLRETEKRLRALAGLRQLEQGLRRRRRPGTKIEELLLDRLGAVENLSPKLLHDAPALLRPLHQALKSRWRGLLQLVFERRGTAGLAVLHAARPELFAADLDPGKGAAKVREWAELRSLRESESFAELGDFLRAAGARVGTTRLADLWSLEIWARHEGAQETMKRGDRLDELHGILVRLLEMARGISGRFAAVERPEVARFLRGELFELCDELHFCGHAQDAAEALLAHLGDDAGLLIVALAGAVCSDDDRARRTYAARISARGPARGDRETLFRLIASVAAERPVDSAPVLTALEPLFGDDWSEVLDRVAPRAVDAMQLDLIEASDAATFDPEEAAWTLGAVRRDLDLYRPLLGERPELAALDVAVSCWGTEPAAAALQVRNFLRRFEGLEPALMLHRQTRELSDDIVAGIDSAIIAAIVERLDSRWHLWASCVMHHLAFGDASAKLVRRLKQKIRGILKEETLDGDDRATLERILKDFGELRGLKRLVRLAEESLPGSAMPDLEPDEPESRPKKKPRARRRKPVDDRQLDLFEPA